MLSSKIAATSVYCTLLPEGLRAAHLPQIALKCATGKQKAVISRSCRKKKQLWGAKKGLKRHAVIKNRRSKRQSHPTFCLGTSKQFATAKNYHFLR